MIKRADLLGSIDAGSLMRKESRFVPPLRGGPVNLDVRMACA
jgi:hypothetical protein